MTREDDAERQRRRKCRVLRPVGGPHTKASGGRERVDRSARFGLMSRVGCGRRDDQTEIQQPGTRSLLRCGRLPDRVLLFQGPHERESDDEDDLIVCIAETLIHEIGHYFGMSEEQIEEIEEKYWAETADDAGD